MCPLRACLSLTNVQVTFLGACGLFSDSATLIFGLRHLSTGLGSSQGRGKAAARPHTRFPELQLGGNPRCFAPQPMGFTCPQGSWEIRRWNERLVSTVSGHATGPHFRFGGGETESCDTRQKWQLPVELGGGAEVQVGQTQSTTSVRATHVSEK